MKKIIIIIYSMIIIFMLTGCNEGQSSATPKYSSQYYMPNISTLAKDEDYYKYFYVVDNNTGVVYIQFYGCYRAGITVALNSDGTPMTIDQIKMDEN